MALMVLAQPAAESAAARTGGSMKLARWLHADRRWPQRDRAAPSNPAEAPTAQLLMERAGRVGRVPAQRRRPFHRCHKGHAVRGVLRVQLVALEWGLELGLMLLQSWGLLGQKAEEVALASPQSTAAPAARSRWRRELLQRHLPPPGRPR